MTRELTVVTVITRELTVITRESTVINVGESYNVRIDSYNCRRQLRMMSTFEPVFSRVRAASQVKNTRIGLAENLKTASGEDNLIKGK